MNIRIVDLVSHLRGPLATLAAFLAKEGRTENEIEETILRVFKIEDAELRAQAQKILAVAALARALRDVKGHEIDDLPLEQVAQAVEDLEAQDLRRDEKGSVIAPSVENEDGIRHPSEGNIIPISRSKRIGVEPTSSFAGHQSNKVVESVWQSRTAKYMRAAAADGTLPSDVADKEVPDRHFDRLDTLAVPQGQVTFWDGGKLVYVSFSEEADASILELGLHKQPYSLKPCVHRLELFEVENLTPADADEFITSHLQDPERFPVAWR